MARNCPREARTGFPAGLYENILSKGNSGRNEAGTDRSKSQQKRYEKCGLAGWSAFVIRISGFGIARELPVRRVRRPRRCENGADHRFDRAGGLGNRDLAA